MRGSPHLRQCQASCVIAFEGPVSAETCVDNLKQQAFKAGVLDLYKVCVLLSVHLSASHTWTSCHAKILCPSKHSRS